MMPTITKRFTIDKSTRGLPVQQTNVEGVSIRTLFNKQIQVTNQLWKQRPNLKK